METFKTECTFEAQTGYEVKVLCDNIGSITISCGEKSIDITADDIHILIKMLKVSVSGVTNEKQIF